MATRTFYECDNCGAEGEHLGPLDLGDGPKMIDLCTGCQDGLGLPKLRLILEEYGAVLDKTQTGSRSPSQQPVRCPRCGATYTMRKSAMEHAVGRHDMDLVQASHLIPPAGPGEECPDCGMLCAAGGGLAIHRASHQ